MTAMTKEQLISEMQVLGEKLSELVKTFNGDVQLTISGASNGYISMTGAVFEDDGKTARVSAMPIRRYYSTVNKRWEAEAEDAYPEVHEAPSH